MNPVEKELQKLNAQWEAFMASDKPIFHWSLKTDAQQLAKTFIRYKEQTPESLTDMTIGLPVDFFSASDYGYALASALQEAIIAGIAVAETDDMAMEALPSWQSLDIKRYPYGFRALFAVCEQCIQLYGQAYDTLTLAMLPQQVSDPEAYSRWWAECCRICRDYTLRPQKLRLVVFDSQITPFLADIAHDHPDLVYHDTDNTNMKAALAQVVDEANDGSPGAVLRKHLFEMNYAMGEQNRTVLEQHAQQALAIAEQHELVDMLATTLLIRAAAYLNLQCFDLSISDYRQAQSHAAKGKEAQVPGCDKLLLQAVLCEGTAHFTKGDFIEAAFAYQRAAPIGEALSEKLMTMEAWRMAAFSFERAKDKNKAWQSGRHALVVAETMDEKERSASTLSYVGEGLLRVAPDYDAEKSVITRMRQLLGDDWQQVAKPEVAAC